VCPEERRKTKAQKVIKREILEYVIRIINSIKKTSHGSIFILFLEAFNFILLFRISSFYSEHMKGVNRYGNKKYGNSALNFYGILRDAPSIYLHGNFD
jgi:hypothetical protein